MDSPVVFFLMSKRFWAGIAAVPIGWALTKWPPLMDVATTVCTQMSDTVEKCDPVVTKAFVIAGVSFAIPWLVGMWMGKRGLSLKPQKKPAADSSESGDANAITPAPKGN